MIKDTIVRDLFGRVGIVRVTSRNRAIIDASVDWFDLPNKPGVPENVAIHELLQLRLYCPGESLVVIDD